MLKLLMIIPLVITFAANAFTQECPMVTVTGPAGIVEPGENVRFYFSAKPERPSRDLSFVWTVSGGKIIGPNDKDILEVRPEKYFNRVMTAAVTVAGLPDGCPVSASDTFSVVCDPYLVMDANVSFWDQYFDLEWKEERQRLDAVVADGLKRYPTRAIYIEMILDIRFSNLEVEARMSRLKDHLNRKVPANRLFIRTYPGDGDRNRTNIYLVPNDAPVLDPDFKDECRQ